MILEDDVVRLEPFKTKDDYKYLVDLAMKCKYTRLTRDEAEVAVLKYPIMAWNGHEKKTNKKIGVIYITKAPISWMLDAYRDDKLVKEIDNTADYSFHAGKLVCDYAFKFTKTLVTCHAFDNRAATIVCKRLGFKEDFIMLKKERKDGT